MSGWRKFFVIRYLWLHGRAVRVSVWFRWVAVGVLALFLATPTHGQDRPAMTYQQAWGMVQERNLDLAAARRERAVRQAAVAIASTRPNPSTSAEFSRDEPHASVLLEWPIELGGQRQKRIDLAEAEGKLFEAEYAELIKEVRAESRRSFYGLLLRMEQAQLERRQLEIAQRATQAAEERFQEGAAPFLEVRQARLEESRSGARIDLAEKEIMAARIELAALLNLDEAQLPPVVGDLEAFPPQFDLDEYLQTALQQNPRVQALVLQIDAEERRSILLHAENSPGLSAIGGADLGSTDFSAGPRVGLSVEIPLVQKRSGEIQRAQAVQFQLQIALEAARHKISAAVTAAASRLRAQQARLLTWRGEISPTAEELEQLALESYREGRSSILGVLEAQRSRREVESELLQAKFDLQMAVAALEEAGGVVIP